MALLYHSGGSPEDIFVPILEIKTVIFHHIHNSINKNNFLHWLTCSENENIFHQTYQSVCHWNLGYWKYLWWTCCNLPWAILKFKWKESCVNTDKLNLGNALKFYFGQRYFTNFTKWINDDLPSPTTCSVFVLFASFHMNHIQFEIINFTLTLKHLLRSSYSFDFYIYLFISSYFISPNICLRVNPVQVSCFEMILLTIWSSLS